MKVLRRNKSQSEVLVTAGKTVVIDFDGDNAAIVAANDFMLQSLYDWSNRLERKTFIDNISSNMSEEVRFNEQEIIEYAKVGVIDNPYKTYAR